jgi:hypothetical protein
MHFLFTWQVRARASARRKEIEDAFTKVVNSYSWIKPINNCVVVQFASAPEHTKLKDSLVDAAKSFGDDVYILITPPMPAGQYYGWLPRNVWSELNSKSV